MSGKMPRGSPYFRSISYSVGFGFGFGSGSGSGCGDGLRMKEMVKGFNMKKRRRPKWNLEVKAMVDEE